MGFSEAAFFGTLGNAIFQLVKIHQFRTSKKHWPWQDKKTAATIGYFIFSVIVKLLAAFVFSGMLGLTGQISGQWAAFLSGMVAEIAIIELGNYSKKELAK